MRNAFCKRPLTVAVLFVAAASIGSALQGQPTGKTAMLKGVVTARVSGRPVQGAEVVLQSDRRTAVSDSVGAFTFAQLPVGASQVTVRAIGYMPTTIIVELEKGQVLEQRIVLEGPGVAQQLPEVGVNAEAPPTAHRLADFERRRRLGRGRYLDEEQIAKTGAFNLQDTFTSMRGVEVICNKAGSMNDCYVHMTRAPAFCGPNYIVDNRESRDFGPATPIRDIVAMEVYTGPSDVPGEFAGNNAMCGVIVLWTRSGSTRRTP